MSNLHANLLVPVHKWLIRCLRLSSRFLRWAKILILGILNVCLWLKFSPALNSKKLSYLWTGTS